MYVKLLKLIFDHTQKFQVPQVDLTRLEVNSTVVWSVEAGKSVFATAVLPLLIAHSTPLYSILDPPENVQLMTNATASKACQNDVVSFMCSADAVPSAMSFQLFKDNVPMETSDSGMWAKPLSEGGVFAYKCVANNSIGSASSATVSITVNGKWDCYNTLVLMLTLKNDLTDSSYARCDPYVPCIIFCYISV